MVFAVDVEYVAARRALLDALFALEKHPSPIVLIGAQAVYLRTGTAEFDISVDPSTTDADLALNPAVLGADPQLEDVMAAAGFARTTCQPGAWLTNIRLADGISRTVEVDLMVPEALAGPGSRAARLPDQAKHVARRGRGLEAAMIDNNPMVITSYEESDVRVVEVAVAGTAALLIAKAHKLYERIKAETVERRPTDRVRPKDAGDVFRLAVQAEPPDIIGGRLRKLAQDDMAAEAVVDGIGYLEELFARRRTRGVGLAIKALSTGGGVPAERIEVLLPNYINELLAAFRSTA
ncbi:hypothetical protein HH310_04420 [Actinoplanes sp. TBRC 11911]|uniref:hypothetical protein n=1 Tax=Actinoplanes sp. TBRC 11911 TaxID=2729386 RepID=UPI00145E8598|nr:hypothetical protein [Actinoplanes sp. TBRC 11911]NMO50436.1 hypothetical protein [Actinoplanes sp. TBRC 11911]